MNCPVILLRRVRWPMAGWPHGVLGGIPVGRFALATTMRMVARVHDHSANFGPTAHVPRAAGLADALVLVIEVADLADGGHAAHVDATDLARRHAHLRVLAFLGEQLAAENAGVTSKTTIHAMPARRSGSRRADHAAPSRPRGAACRRTTCRSAPRLPLTNTIAGTKKANAAMVDASPAAGCSSSGGRELAQQQHPGAQARVQRDHGHPPRLR